MGIYTLELYQGRRGVCIVKEAGRQHRRQRRAGIFYVIRHCHQRALGEWALIRYWEFAFEFDEKGEGEKALDLAILSWGYFAR